MVDVDYNDRANRWVAESVAVGILIGIVNLLVLSGGPTLFAYVVSFGISVIGVLFVAYRLFYHMDTLILQRLVEFEEETLHE